MNELEQIRVLSEIIGSNILTAVALWLFVSERIRHDVTNKEHKRDLRRVAQIQDQSDPDE